MSSALSSLRDRILRYIRNYLFISATVMPINTMCDLVCSRHDYNASRRHCINHTSIQKNRSNCLHRHPPVGLRSDTSILHRMAVYVSWRRMITDNRRASKTDQFIGCLFLGAHTHVFCSVTHDVHSKQLAIMMAQLNHLGRKKSIWRNCCNVAMNVDK